MAKQAKPIQPYRGGVRPAPGVGRPYPVRPGAPRPTGQRPVPRRPEPVPVKKNRRKEREYFFIMKRGVCFFIMVFALVWLAVFALSFLKILPNFTSILIEPDRTPISLREEQATDELDEDGNPIIQEYEDKSVFIGLDDMIYGSIGKLLKKPQVDADGASKSPYYDNLMKEIDTINGAASENADTEGEPEAEENPAATSSLYLAGEEEGGDAEGEESEETPVVDERGEVAAEDTMFSIGTMAVTYFPIVLAVGVVLALLILLLAFFALFGRRIFRGFTIMAILLLVVGVLTLLGGIAASGIRQGLPTKDSETGEVTSIVDFSRIVEFLTGSFTPVPEEEVEVEEGQLADLIAVGGIPLLVFAAAPVAILVLSFFTKKKVPYSIFDR